MKEYKHIIVIGINGEPIGLTYSTNFITSNEILSFKNDLIPSLLKNKSFNEDQIKKIEAGEFVIKGQYLFTI